MWYTNEPRENATAIADLFMQEYPEIDVEILRLPGEKIAAKLEAEFSGAGLEGDVAYVTPGYTVQRLAENGAFAPYYPENIDEVDDKYKDPNGNWVSTGYTPLVAIAYNTNEVTKDEAPASWEDLTEEKWKNNIALGDPASLTVATQAAASWMQNFGEDYIEQLGDNNPVILSSFGDTEAAILSGSSPVGTVTDFRTYADMAEGHPIELVLPEEGAIATPGAMGINADAPHPNAARLFENFLYSDAVMDQYAKNYTYPIRPGFAGEGMPDLQDVKLLPTDDSVLTDPNEMVSLRRQLNSLLG
ncbi:hypothetical protein A6F49_06975 [Enteractinococcus helveticum]|uniref:ABC transporter substrate-binding protein n=1 Tax=Enteractinococcus helveticum TaxID=1837282 RepID=A0A1B7M1H3_9MICC|nr:hypothetical protein A6F49_06975 [Enteractinococcus helveticum]